MAATKKTTKKAATKKATKNKGLSYEDKKLVWLAVTVVVVMLVYVALTFFA